MLCEDCGKDVLALVRCGHCGKKICLDCLDEFHGGVLPLEFVEGVAGDCALGDPD